MQKTDMPLGLYIHIPFCISKCPYCDFYSVPFNDSAADEYTAALIRSVELSGFSGCAASLYFGGGTPYLLGEKRLASILDAISRHFCIIPESEITIEANPCDVYSGSKLSSIRKIGFNRISIGMQSALGDELYVLGRRHTHADTLRAFYAARESGFDNISLDIMLGIPGQNIRSALFTSEAAVSLGAEHISVYLLKIEENTPFGRILPSPHPADDELASDIYLEVSRHLSDSGYEHYEISNFSLPGYSSRHNLKYWTLSPYIGFGCSSHSFYNDNRFYYPRDISSFIKAEDPNNLIRFDSKGATAEEYVMLSFRLSTGVSLNILSDLYGLDTMRLQSAAGKLKDSGLVFFDGKSIRATDKGYLLSNSVIVFLLEALGI